MAAFSRNLVVRTRKKGNRSPYRTRIYASLQRLEQIIVRIETGEFPAQPDYRRCEGCPYGDLCESQEDERK